MSPRKYPPTSERLAAKTLIGDTDDCWPFTGKAASRSGHRQITHNGRQQLAHRVAWELVNGPIPAGMCVCHSCDNPPCVNVRHLFLGTVADNNADRDRKGRGVTPPPELIRRRKAGPIRHGTVYAYVQRKCRCVQCIQANSSYRAEKRRSA